MIDDLQEIIAHLKTNKLRTALTGISVSVGIFMLIVLLGAGNGVLNAVLYGTGDIDLNAMIVRPGQTSKPYGGYQKDRTITMDARDMDAATEGFPQQVTKATGQISQAATVSYRDQSRMGMVNGQYPDNADIRKIKILHGRYINDLDMKERRKSIVIDKNTAKDFFGSAEDAVGKELLCDKVVFTVVGVTAEQGMIAMVSCDVPFTTLQTIYNKGNDIAQITLHTQGLDNERSDSLFQNSLRAAMAGIHYFAPDDKKAVYMLNTTQGSKEMNKALNYLRFALWVIGILTLLSGVVGISNIMLITVKERTHEFGIRKALGAHPWGILRSVILESVIITALFGYIGLVCGVAATEYMNYVAGKTYITIMDHTFYTFLNPTVDMDVAIKALIVLIVAGLLAGFIPARKAVRVKPIEALMAN